jgi:heat-inducible transcriptional repressor
MLDERSRQILCAIVQSYISSPEPVGSRYVTKKYTLGFSPATIRNIMADLEDLGFLSQPHTSAGRIPTDKGYRFFVDNILCSARKQTQKELPDNFVSGLTKRLDLVKNDKSSVFSEIADTLSNVSNYVSIALPPVPERTTFNKIDLIKYKDGLVVATLLTNEGIIKNKVISVDPKVTQSDLDRIRGYLNSEYAGYLLDDIKDALVSRVKREKVIWDKLIERAIKIFEESFLFDNKDVYVSGLYDVMNLPDFADIERIKEFSKAIKEKHIILKLLDELSEAEGVQVVIGNENSVDELKGFSVVASNYKEGGRPIGTIALIGPTRMDYYKAICMVETVAGCLSRTFD